MTKIPKWMAEKVRSKASFRTCEENRFFTVPYSRAFRFLMDVHQFQIVRIERMGRQLAIEFRLREHRITLVDENGRLFEIYYAVMKTSRSPEPAFSFGIEELIAKYSSDQDQLEVCDTLKQELNVFANLLETHWDSIFSDIEILIAKQKRALKRFKSRVEKFLASDSAFAKIVFDVNSETKSCSFVGDLPTRKSYNLLDEFAVFKKWFVLFDVTVRGKPQV